VGLAGRATCQKVRSRRVASIGRSLTRSAGGIRHSAAAGPLHEDSRKAHASTMYEECLESTACLVTLSATSFGRPCKLQPVSLHGLESRQHGERDARAWRRSDSELLCTHCRCNRPLPRHVLSLSISHSLSRSPTAMRAPFKFEPVHAFHSCSGKLSNDSLNAW